VSALPWQHLKEETFPGLHVWVLQAGEKAGWDISQIPTFTGQGLSLPKGRLHCLLECWVMWRCEWNQGVMKQGYRADIGLQKISQTEKQVDAAHNDPLWSVLGCKLFKESAGRLWRLEL
jgi:hypothetical protein